MTRAYWKTGLALMGMLGLGLTLSAAPQAQGEKPKPTIKLVGARPIDSIEGKENFAAYCAVCHGKDARGAGPAAEALKAKVPDLTILAKKSGGKFSALDVRNTISGTNKWPSSHGTSDMPMWGPVFRSLQPDRGVTMLRVKNLVDYIESIQVK